MDRQGLEQENTEACKYDIYVLGRGSRYRELGERSKSCADRVFHHLAATTIFFGFIAVDSRMYVRWMAVFLHCRIDTGGGAGGTGCVEYMLWCSQIVKL